MTTKQIAKTDECCPKFNPEPWDGKMHTWKDRLFAMDTVVQVMHIPLNMGQVVTRMWKKIQDAKADTEAKDFLMLAYDPSPWKSELYMAVTKEVPGMKNIKLSGRFLSKVFDGPYNAVPKWMKEMDSYALSKNEKVKKYYFYYTTCPKCAKKYGHNYTVAFAQVE